MLDDQAVKHEAAMLRPTPVERPIVALVGTIEAIISVHGTENRSLNKGLANLIIGTSVLLTIHSSWGRLDRQLLLDQLDQLALKINFDLQSRTFTYGGTS